MHGNSFCPRSSTVAELTPTMGQRMRRQMDQQFGMGYYVDPTNDQMTRDKINPY